MMCGFDCDLDVVAHDTGASAARRHRAGIRIGQRDLLVRCGEHLHLENLEPLHLLLQLRDLLFQAARLGFERLGRLLPIGGVELLQIARDALLDLRHAPLHLGAREVLVAVVHRLELAAVDRHAGLREQAQGAAQPNKPGADLADGAAVVLAEVSNRLVIGSKPAREPHHLNVAPGLAFKPPARLMRPLLDASRPTAVGRGSLSLNAEPGYATWFTPALSRSPAPARTPAAPACRGAAAA